MSHVLDAIQIAGSNTGGFVLCLLALWYFNRKLSRCEQSHKDCREDNKRLERRCTQLEVQLIRINPKVDNMENALKKLHIGEFDFMQGRN